MKLKKSIQITYDGISFEIPKGFKTDGVSIPRLFWWFGKPFDDDCFIPALVHDFLYTTRLPKLSCDLIFLHLMEENDVSWFKRYVYFISVLIFGKKRVIIY